MKAIRYKTELHSDALDLLLHSNGIDMRMNTPKVGYIAYNLGDAPVAAGFLRLMEGGYAQFDGLVSNANFDSAARHEGIDAVVKALIKHAKRLKLKGIIALTRDAGVITRANALGFKDIEHTCLVLSLT